MISLTPENKNSYSLSLTNKDTGMTWDQATMTWDEQTGQWDAPLLPLNLDSKNSSSLTLDNKN